MAQKKNGQGQHKPQGKAVQNKGSAAGKRQGQSATAARTAPSEAAAKAQPAVQNKPAGKSAGQKSKSGGAVKARSQRSEQPADVNTRGQKAGQAAEVKAQVQRSERTPQASAPDQTVIVCAISVSGDEKERRSLIALFIAWLRAVLSFKKGERNEFRFNYDENHPGYVFKEEDGKLKSFGLTHSESTFGVKNMPLEENPNSTDAPAYIRNGVITSKKKRNSGRMKNLSLSPKDKAKVKSKKRNYEKVAKQQKAKNKKSK